MTILEYYVDGLPPWPPLHTQNRWFYTSLNHKLHSSASYSIPPWKSASIHVEYFTIPSYQCTAMDKEAWAAATRRKDNDPPLIGCDAESSSLRANRLIRQR